MTYELYVFDAERVADVDGARKAHDDMPYFERSRPVSDTGARKWRTVRALQAGNCDLTLVEQEKPRRGEPELRYVQLANLETAHALCLNVFDEAVEIVLEVPEVFTDAGAVVKATFADLLRLEMEGYARVYDAQLDRLLDPASDEDLVLRAYAASAGMIARGALRPAASPSEVTSIKISAKSARTSSESPPQQVPAPSAGANPKPWWKFW